jgi:UDP-glucose 4-epimerase
VTVSGVAHDADLSRIDFDAYAGVACFAYDERLRNGPYDEALDFERAVARAINRSHAHFIMLSTRRVYGTSAPFPASEDAPVAPDDNYGRNKLRTEAAIEDMLDGRHTILRLANIFGFEVGRRTFFGIALKSLREGGRVTLDISPTVRRDFLPVGDFARVFYRVAALRPQGVFNLGSGQATAVGDVASWLIEGYGSGSIAVSAPRLHDAFLLDSQRLLQRIGAYGATIDIRAQCLALGQRLRDG